MAALAETFDIVDEGWKTTAVGYADRKIIVVQNGGFWAEVQNWNDVLFKAKSGSHVCYARAAGAKARGDMAAYQEAVSSG